MDLTLSPSLWPPFLPRFLLAAILFSTYGCGDDSDAKVVDFSETMAVERPGDRSMKDLLLQVAVGAMMSPKEYYAYHSCHFIKGMELGM